MLENATARLDSASAIRTTLVQPASAAFAPLKTESRAAEMDAASPWQSTSSWSGRMMQTLSIAQVALHTLLLTLMFPLAASATPATEVLTAPKRSAHPALTSWEARELRPVRSAPAAANVTTMRASANATMDTLATGANHSDPLALNK